MQDSTMQKEYFEVVLESIESKHQLILECLSTLDKKIDDVRDELKDDDSLLNVKITTLSGRIGAVDEKLTKKIDAVDTRLGKVENNLTGRIDALHSELVAHPESVVLHKAPRRRVLKQV